MKVDGRDDLELRLDRIDGKGYRAYKDLAGAYDMGDFCLYIDHVQGDPFAAPSKIRMRVPQSLAAIPRKWFSTPIRRMALEDFLGRAVAAVIDDFHTRRGSSKSGQITVDAGGQEVFERTTMVLRETWVEVRLQVGLPASGRRVLGRQARELLCNDLARIAQKALHWQALDTERATHFVCCIENGEAIRNELRGRGLIAFIADGSILPRRSGVNKQPLTGAVPFVSPPTWRVSFRLPNPLTDGRQELQGMGIPAGVTLIVGGGYHGKSTLLQALEQGVYPQIPGDGREYVVTVPEAVKIRAEDGRRVVRTDISAFIDNLPLGRDTTRFCSEDASGSTSQAANIVEAVEVGARCLLLDEDTSATNFMIRDARMQTLVHKQGEPITPFVDRVRDLYTEQDVSSVIVMGGSGDYFDVADHLIQMRNYQAEDSTAEAKRICNALPTGRRAEAAALAGAPSPRCPIAASLNASRGRREVKIDVRARDHLLFGEQSIELSGVTQILHSSQTRAIGYALYLAVSRFMDDTTDMSTICKSIEALLDREGLDVLDPFHRDEKHPGNFARPRHFEIAAAMNRLRTLRIQ